MNVLAVSPTEAAQSVMYQSAWRHSRAEPPSSSSPKAVEALTAPAGTSISPGARTTTRRRSTVAVGRAYFCAGENILKVTRK